MSSSDLTEDQKYAYYPGCSAESTAKEYDLSVLAICPILGLELVELPDWNCCGASSGHQTDYWLSHALAGRNLALAEREGLDLAVACPACFIRLKSTQYEVSTNFELKENLPKLIGLPYEGKYEVRHLLDIICNTVGIDAVKKEVKKPLNGLKVVAYYGCYLARPPQLIDFDDAENPMLMDLLLQAIGAEVPDWGGKVECCGGSLSLSRKDVSPKLVNNICEAAREVGAEALVTACPLCHINLEMGQRGRNPLPVLYFTELLGLAFGLQAKPWFKRHLISPFNLLANFL